ncbi:MAG: hypothetical protein U0T84_08265 [Chitinophagales bacterium]
MKQLFLLLFVVGALCAQAQSPEKRATDSLQRVVNHQPDTLRNGFFKARRFHSSFHVQAEGDVTWIFRRAALYTGGSMRWVVNHKISIGLSGTYLTSNTSVGRFLTPPFPDSIAIKPTLFSVQLNAGYVFRAFRKFSIHPELNAGYTQLSFHDKTTNQDVTLRYGTANPVVHFVWNTTKYFRIGGLLGARLVFGQKYENLGSTKLSGVYAGVFIRGGTF